MSTAKVLSAAPSGALADCRAGEPIDVGRVRTTEAGEVYAGGEPEDSRRIQRRRRATSTSPASARKDAGVFAVPHRLRIFLDRFSVSLIEAAIASVAVWLHIRSLPSLPRGFYKDEISIAYNAHLIATTGRDEFGVSWPMYIESFGDTKNAGYVYLSALVTRLFGLTLWTVRMPSLLCWLLGTLLFYLLGRRLWPAAPARIFLLSLLAFTPSLFCMSRVGFEVIALYPALGLFLLGVWRGFEERSLRWAALAGVGIGAATYMYTTFRMLAPLHCLLVLSCYPRREYLKLHAVFAAAAALTVIPFAIYFHSHYEQLTMRYREIGYLHEAIPLRDKFDQFVARYSDYFSVKYLLLEGDPNPRHHTGFGGELYLPLLLFMLVGTAAILLSPRVRKLRWNRLLLGGVVLAPIAAALTKTGSHSLQSFSLVLFAILLATTGLQYAADSVPRLSGKWAVGARVSVWLVVAWTLFDAAAFVRHYFGPYKEISIAAFEYYGQRQAIEKAIRSNASRILLDHRRRGRHAELLAPFYRHILEQRLRRALPPIEPGMPKDLRPGEFLIYQDRKDLFRDLRDGMPPGALYLAVPYDVIKRPRRLP